MTTNAFNNNTDFDNLADVEDIFKEVNSIDEASETMEGSEEASETTEEPADLDDGYTKLLDQESTELDDYDITDDDIDNSQLNSVITELLSSYLRQSYSPNKPVFNIFNIYDQSVLLEALEYLVNNKFKIVHIRYDEYAVTAGATIVYIEPTDYGVPNNVVNYSIAFCNKKDNYNKKVGALIAACNYFCGATVPIVLPKRGFYSKQLKDFYTALHSLEFQDNSIDSLD